MAKWEWAALWKAAAKKQKAEADRYFMAWIKAVVQLGWRGRQARIWKKAAKNYRAMFKLCACTSVPLWQERYWASKRNARAWKAAAKKWRKRASSRRARMADQHVLRLALLRWRRCSSGHHKSGLLRPYFSSRYRIDLKLMWRSSAALFLIP